MLNKLIVILSIFILSNIHIAFADNLDPNITEINKKFTSINRINSPLLETFLISMPKGGDLHNHLAGAAYPEWLLGYVREDKSPTNNWCAIPISKPSSGYTAINLGSISDCSSVKGIYLKTLQVGSDSYNQLVRDWSMEGYDIGESSNFGHDHFFSAFEKTALLTETYQTRILADLMKQAAHQHLNYLELMVKTDKGVYSAKTYAESITALPSNPNTLTYSQVVAAINQLESYGFTKNVVSGTIVSNARNLVTNARNLLGCNNSNKPDGCNVLVRFQYPAKRTDTFNEVFTGLYAGFTAAKIAPSQFVGVNLVAPEDNENALLNYNAQMQLIQYLEQYYNNSIKVSLHAGELTETVTNLKGQQVLPTDLTYHINNAVVVAGASRIGHGIDYFNELATYTTLTRTMQANSNVVEINLTSNEQILGVCDGKPYCQPPVKPYIAPYNYKFNHPFYFYILSNIPTVLATDDQGIEVTTLTNEYYEAVTRYQLTYSQLKDIDRNSLTFSFLPGGQLWAVTGQYNGFVSQCSQDNPYTKSVPSVTCQAYLNVNQKAQMEWNLESQFAAFEKNLNLYYIPNTYLGTNYAFKNPVNALADRFGNIWVVNQTANNITELPVNNPNNPILYSGANYGFNQIWNIGTDNTGNIWVTNRAGNSVTKLPVNSPTNPVIYSGVGYKFNGPYGVTSDSMGNIWITNIDGNSVTELPVSNPNAPIIYSGTNYSFNQPALIVADKFGNIWITNQAGNSVTEITAQPNPNSPIVYSGANYKFNNPYGIDVDSKNNIWVANFLSNTVTEIPSANPSAPIVYSGSNYGFNYPFQVNVDVFGNIWITNEYAYSVTKIPANNFSAPIIYSGTSYNFNRPTGLTSDKFGNIWIPNYGGNSVTELISSLNP